MSESQSSLHWVKRNSTASLLGSDSEDGYAMHSKIFSLGFQFLDGLDVQAILCFLQPTYMF
jgi:hypothetical protein